MDLTIAVYLNYYCYHKSSAEPGKMMCELPELEKKNCNRYLRKHSKTFMVLHIQGILESTVQLELQY